MKRIVFIYFFFLFSCNNAHENKNKLVENFLEDIMPSLNDIRHCIIIPGEGCGGCITNAGHYIKSNLDSLGSSYAIIFTGVKDIKLFYLEFGKEFSKRSNVFIDKSDHFMNPQVSSVYPQIIEIKNGVVLKISPFTP